MVARDDQRSRTRRALIDLCYEDSFAAVTVDSLCRRAGLAREDFEREHESLEGCFLEVYRPELERFRALTSEARDGLESWRDRLRATAYALCRFLAEDPRITNLVAIEVRSGGEPVRRLFGEAVDELIDLVDEGRQEPEAPASLTRATAETIGGGIFNQLYVALGGGGAIPSEAKIVPHLMYTAVLPYVGEDAALEELEIEPSPAPADTRHRENRIFSALIDLCYERGVQGVTVELLLEHAAIERWEFDRRFTGLDDCFDRFFEAEKRHILASMAAARTGLPSWRDRLRATAYALQGCLTEDACITKVILIDIRSASEQTKLNWAEGFTAFVEFVDEVRFELDDPDAVSRSTAEAIAGGIYGQMFSALSTGSVSFEDPIVPELMYAAVLPYFGEEAALEELSIPPPESQAR